MMLFFVFLALSSGATINPMTRQVADDVGGLNNIGSFRFYVSTDVTFTKVERTVDTDKAATTVQERIVRDTVYLTANTTGRLQHVSDTGSLEVGFEELKDGSIPTLTFIQKISGPDEKYYFDYQYDGSVPYIFYDGERYTVSYKGKEEPYLKYQRTSNEKENRRKIRGIR
jgi:hypothetical protein